VWVEGEPISSGFL